MKIQSLGQPITLNFTRGDWDSVVALTIRMLALLVLFPAILIRTFHFAPELVFGQIIPGLALTLLVGSSAFAYYAARLAAVRGRPEVTALPYGLSTPVMFVFLFGMMGPVYFSTRDPLQAYRIGLGAAFVGGLVELSGAVIGPWLHRVTPRPGLLGTIAGVALVWIAVVPLTLIFSSPLIGLVSLFVALLGILGCYRFPFHLPVGMVVIILGVGLGLLTGEVRPTLESVAVAVPVPVLGDLWAGLKLLLARPEFLAVIIPIEISNFIETIGNVESARTAGDPYAVRPCLLIQGAGTCLGAMLGSPFPTVIWIGHPAYKQLNAGPGYTLLTGLFLFAAAALGLLAFLYHLVPAASAATLLVVVGLLMVQHAFQASPPAHGVAIALAMAPHLADLLHKQLAGMLLEILPGGTTPALLARLAENHAVYLPSYALLAQGAILTGLLWGSIAAFLVEGKLRQAALFSSLAFFLSLVGLIHAEQIGLSFSPVTAGYLVVTLLFGLFYLHQRGAGGND